MVAGVPWTVQHQAVEYGVWCAATKPAVQNHLGKIANDEQAMIQQIGQEQSAEQIQQAGKKSSQQMWEEKRNWRELVGAVLGPVSQLRSVFR